MSHKEDAEAVVAENAPTHERASAAPAASVTAAAPRVEEKLDGIEDIDFLLEEIENKIAPLALA